MSGPEGDRLTRTAAERAELRAAGLSRLRRRRVLAGLGVAVVLAMPVAAAGLLSVDTESGDDGGSKRAATQADGAQGPAKNPGAPAPATSTQGSQAAVPILMYHVINTPKADTANPELWVPRERFAAQVSELDRQGYEAVTLQRVYDAWKGKGSLPAKPIVLSFDDGYDSHFKNALPILKAKQWEGVENLQIDQTKSDLEPEEVKALIAAGWEIDVHTYSHPDLTTVDDATLERETADARKEIQQTYGVKANFFCYPAGKFDERVIAALKGAGFIGATTTVEGVASPDSEPFELERIRINGSDDLQTFKDKVAVGGTGLPAQ